MGRIGRRKVESDGRGILSVEKGECAVLMTIAVQCCAVVEGGGKNGVSEKCVAELAKLAAFK
jgi:hypothetical protein